jgi:hypothetical protein
MAAGADNTLRKYTTLQEAHPARYLLYNQSYFPPAPNANAEFMSKASGITLQQRKRWPFPAPSKRGASSQRRAPQRRRPVTVPANATTTASSSYQSRPAQSSYTTPSYEAPSTQQQQQQPRAHGRSAYRAAALRANRPQTSAASSFLSPRTSHLRPTTPFTYTVSPTGQLFYRSVFRPTTKAHPYFAPAKSLPWRQGGFDSGTGVGRDPPL